MKGLLLLACVAAVSAAPYTVAYTTGPESSTMPVHLTLIGSKGSSRELFLGKKFSANADAVRKFNVKSDIGTLQKITLRAGKGKGVGWIARNFITVVSPSKQESQFRADYCMDSKVHGNPVYRNIFPYADQVTIKPVVTAKHQKIAKLYKVKFTTGKRSDSASTDTEYIQFIGARGASHFYILGNSFKKGQTNEVTLRVSENIGRLARINLEAGGEDGWQTVGSVDVVDPTTANTYAFATNFYLDDTPHAKGASKFRYYYQKEIHEKLTAAEITFRNSKKALPTRAPTAAPKFAPTFDKKPSHADSTKNGVSINSARPTRAPTAAPTPPNWLCRYGPYKNEYKAHGWKGPGFGNQYCNLWTCKQGKMVKQKKNCDIAWFGIKKNIPAGAKYCSHVKCAEKSPGKGIFAVSHHSLEKNGLKHRCSFNKFTDKCRCMCWGAKPKYEATIHGRHNFAAKTGWTGTRCEQITFAGNKQFNPKKGPVRVLTSVSHFAPTPKWEHDAAISWVEYASHTGFKVCARESAKWWHSNDKHDEKMHIEYYAFQSGNVKNGLYGSPFPGAQGNTEKLGMTWVKGKTNCHTVKFPKPFDSAPMVLGTIDHDDKKITHDALTFWLEEISGQQFKVCFRETLRNDDWHLPIQFNWISFEHRNPSLWYRNQMPYSAAGREPCGEWALYDKSKINNKKAYLNCKTIKFGKTFQTPPTVLVTANHRTNGDIIDWAKTHDASMTYMDSITTTGFKVCATELARHDGWHDATMMWDWVAFSSHV